MADKERFTLTEQHVKLIRQFNIDWNGDEFGAPTVDPKRPYGSGDVILDIGGILGIKPQYDANSDEPEYTYQQDKQMEAIHAQTKTALQVVLAAGTFTPGVYEADKYRNNWRPVSQ